MSLQRVRLDMRALSSLKGALGDTPAAAEASPRRRRSGPPRPAHDWRPASGRPLAASERSRSRSHRTPWGSRPLAGFVEYQHPLGRQAARWPGRAAAACQVSIRRPDARGRGRPGPTRAEQFLGPAGGKLGRGRKHLQVVRSPLRPGYRRGTSSAPTVRAGSANAAYWRPGRISCCGCPAGSARAPPSSLSFCCFFLLGPRNPVIRP